MPGPQNLVKLNQERSSLKFGPDFCPKLGEDQKKKGLHSNLVVLVQNLTAPKTRARVRCNP